MRTLGNSPLKLAFAICFSSVALLSAPVYAGFEEGLEAYSNDDYAKALTEFKPLAEQGNADAQYWLGVMHHFGNGVTQDSAEAARWYQFAAVQGSANAQSSLGLMYSKGEGVNKDYGESFRWHRLAAGQGNSVSQAMLGIAYSYGEGLPQNYIYAHMWSNIAAGNGHYSARINRDDIAEKMTPLQIEQAQEMAMNCFNSGYVYCGD